MGKLIAIAAALGLLGATSLTPVFAAPAGNAKAQDTAKPAPKKAKKASKKRVSHKRASKKKAKPAPAAKKPEESKSQLILYRIAA